ncbi:unnamed protein product [Rangifer tarandus platyrhynchus]|uniref:Uncharacterized protein n=1 Tax=Rangifer tarandus platyrhynchus TaxID=3082113 RepID=A0AC59YIV2_RANTA
MNPKPPGAPRGTWIPVGSHSPPLPRQGLQSSAWFVLPPSYAAPGACFPPPPPPLSAHPGCPEAPGGADGGGPEDRCLAQRVCVKASWEGGAEVEELRGQREGKGKWNLLQGCPAPLELFLWAAQETLKRVTLTEWSGPCRFSSHPCRKTVAS